MEQSKERDRKCELGYLKRADGSCLYSLGETVVLASVNGPGDLRSSKQLGDRASIEAYFHSKIGGSTSSTNGFVERHLRSALESTFLTKQFPRSSMVITIQEMHDDGCLAASAINAACLASMDAGLPMRTVFAAVACVLISKETGGGDDDVLVVEPNSKIERGNVKAKMIFIFESDGGRSGDESKKASSFLASCSVEGLSTRDQLKTGEELARKKSEDVFRLYRSVVEKKFCKKMEFADDRKANLIEK